MLRLRQASSLPSRKFVEKVCNVGLPPGLLGAVSTADALVGLCFSCMGQPDRGSGAGAPQRFISRTIGTGE
jgi:hypothetical protein